MSACGRLSWQSVTETRRSRRRDFCTNVTLGAAGLRWWSTHEALWMNVTLFDRAASQLRVHSVRALGVDDPAVMEAADFVGLRA